MSYKISYTPEDTDRYPQTKKRRDGNWLQYGMFIIIIIVAFWVKVNGLPNSLIPGNPEITKNAFKTMISNVKSGDAVEDAVFVFCKEILVGAES